MSNLTSFISGLEPEAQTIITDRYTVVSNWITQSLSEYLGSCSDLLEPERFAELGRFLLDAKAQISNPSPHDAISIQQGSARWQRKLLPLAEALGVYDRAYQDTVEKCRRLGQFDRLKPRHTRVDQTYPSTITPIQPELSAIRDQVRALLARTTDREQRIRALLREGLCRNRGNAQAVVSLIEQSTHDIIRACVRDCLLNQLTGTQTDAGMLSYLQSVFDSSPEPDTRVVALVETGLCPNLEQAAIVVQRFAERDARANRYDYTIEKCLKFGLFRQVPSQQRVRPAFDAVYPQVQAIWQTFASPDAQAVALKQQGICHTSDQARQVVELLKSHNPKNRKKAVQTCIARGLFDRPLAPPRGGARDQQAHKPYTMRPPVKDIAHLLNSILASCVTLDQRIDALRAADVCRDETAVIEVARVFDRDNEASALNSIAAGLAWRIVLGYATYGASGLLIASTYPPTETVLLLQQRVALLERGSDEERAMVVCLRRDLLTLYRAFEAVEPSLWRHELVVAPIQSENRRSCQERIHPDQREQIVVAVAEKREVLQSEAAQLYLLLTERGLAGLIDWRRGVAAENAGYQWETDRAQQIVRQHLGALNDAALATIDEMLTGLQHAITETGVTLSLRQIFNSQPHSAYRKRLNRRLPMGYGMILTFRRKDRKYQQRQRRFYRARFRDMPQAQQHNPLAQSSALVQSFAAQVGLREREAATRLYYVRTYGAIGFLPRDEWLDLIDPQVLALLKFYKFARIDGRLNITDVLPQLNHYAQQLGVPPLSPQLAKALSSMLRKPRRWNSGEGERVAHVRKRAGVVLPGTPWLHRVWRLFVWHLPLPVTAPGSGSVGAERCYALVVVDLGCQLPVGVWVSDHPPGTAEAGLGLFQAIWHPGAVDYPLRGSPEILQIPASLLNNHEQPLQDAAWWLAMHVQVVDDATAVKTLPKLPALLALRDDLLLTGVDTIRRRYAGHPMTTKDVQDAVLGWLRTSAVGLGTVTPGQDDPVSVTYGMATPGFNTPGAALLLPVTGEALTIRDGVVANERVYTSDTFRTEPGHRLLYRSFPYIYGGRKLNEMMVKAIYVTDLQGTIHYLVQQEFDAKDA